ncbi:tyrosine-type recombinase/integrase [Rhizobium ruizarguesonis]
MTGVQCITVTDLSDWECFRGRGVHPHIVPGVKILLDGNFNPLSTMNEFTVRPAHRKRRAGKSWKNTQNAYADDCYQYQSFLEALDLDECDVVLDDIKDFGACFTNGVSVKTRRKFQPATAYRRFGTALRYHRFRIFKGLPSSVSLAELLSNGGFREGSLYADPNSPYNELPNDADSADKIHPFLDGDWKPVFDRLGPEVGDTSGRSRRDRLASETSLITGMRIDEICSITVQQIRNLSRHVDPARPSKLISLWITKTKGLKPGFIFLPSFLVEQLLDYIDGERQAAIDRACAVRNNYEPTSILFVNDVKSSYATAGNPLSPDTLSRAFSDACLSIGFSHEVDCFVLNEAGEPLISSSGQNIVEKRLLTDHTFHDLRHTFAMLTYIDSARSGGNEPWKTVCTRLRHSSILTTLRSYLRWLDRAEQEISNALMKTYRMIDDIGASK